MKYIAKSIAVLVLSFASISAFSEEKPMNMQQGKSADKGMMQMSDEMKDKQAQEKQQYILKINDLSDRIQDEKNPEKKQELMDEQLKLIKDHMEQKRQMKKQMMKKHHEKMKNKKDGMKM
ncbi:hypothetical protein AU255_10770 [Methyloprofundus sedimenti]|uniref:Zinc resistance-associated protein n=1 Tax=Methyloprofundus sedimenti TaxID=1420851 RepID=A0A1V8MAF1_9GAMM|nr:hypothetical protein [Methyloprofundus sedimenti]OQK18283.1 hypothetical protein AU255_10770 [Methyloprofundus sedimenti]